MKLGELCEVMNVAMVLKIRGRDPEEENIWVDDYTSFQQKMAEFKDFISWDVVGISKYYNTKRGFEVEIVKPEEEE